MGETEKLKDFLFDTKKYGWEGLPDSVKNDIIKFSDEYIHKSFFKYNFAIL